MSQSNVIVVSAPSGTGKTTLLNRLISENSQIELSISHTTRGPRAGETDGVEYNFVDTKTFKKLVDEDKFLEWAEVHGNHYGTSLEEIIRIRNAGRLPLLEIDVQGWLNARSKLENTVAVFILPPNLRELWERLEKRGSDTLETRWLRFQNAYHEIEITDYYNYFIVNDDLDEAYKELKHIAINGIQGKIDAAMGAGICQKLKEEFKNADWIERLRAELKMSSD